MDPTGATLEELCGIEPWRLAEADVLVALDRIEVARRQIEAARLRVIAEVDNRGIALAQGATSTGALLRTRHQVAPREAARLVRLSRDLAGASTADAGGVPTDEGTAAVEPQSESAGSVGCVAATGAAVAAGTVSPEAGQVIARTMRGLPAAVGDVDRETAQSLLVRWAAEFDTDALARLARSVRDRLIGSAETDAARERAEDAAYRNRALWLSDLGGEWVLRAHLDAEVGGTLAAMIGAFSRPKSPEPGQRDPRSAAQIRADALAQILKVASSTGELPERGGCQPVITLTADVETLRRAVGGQPGLTDDGRMMSTTALRRMACDSRVLPAVMGTRCEPLDLGRSSYVVTTALRRALILRDGGCSWPGCDRPPAWCDAHHLVHWADGGPTSLANCVLLSRHHHRLAHKETWEIRIVLEHPEFVPPAWIDPERRPRRNNRDTLHEIEAALQRGSEDAIVGGPP